MVEVAGSNPAVSTISFALRRALIYGYRAWRRGDFLFLRYGGIAQLVRALASHARGRRFESYCLYQFRHRYRRKVFNLRAAHLNNRGGIAQLVERLNGIQEVIGSIPTISTTKKARISVLF